MSWLFAAALAGYPVHQEDLGHGDTLVVVEDHRAPVVFFRVEIPVARTSPWGWDHDVRTAWNIQLYDPDRTLRQRADDLAIQLDLTQSAEMARISVSCLREDLESALVLVEDVLTNTELHRKELRRWRRGRRLEARADRNDPNHQASLAVRQQLFARGDARRMPWEQTAPMVTTPRTLLATRDAMLAHPGRVVGLSGDVDPALGRQIAARLLPPAQPIDGQTDPVYHPVRPLARRTDETLAHKRLTQVTFRWVRPSVTWSDPEASAALVAHHVLAGHAHARLGQRLRYDEAATYGVSMRDPVDDVEAPTTIITSTRTANAPRAEAILQEELDRFHAEGVTKEELRDAIDHVAGSDAFRNQGPFSPMGTRMWEIRRGLPPGTYDAALDGVGRVTLEQVNGFIERFYDPALFTMVQVVPK